MLIVRAIALSLTLMLSGCQYFEVESSQLGSIKNAFFPSPKQLPDSRWSVLFGGYSAVVQPVSVEKNTLFVNRVDTVSFNGWVVTKVSGLEVLPLPGRFRIRVTKGRLLLMAGLSQSTSVTHG